MITVTIILSMIVLSICWTLFVPVTVEIDTDHGFYRVKLPGLFSLRALKLNNEWKVKGSILFFKFNILKRNRTKDKKKTKRRRKENGISNIPHLFNEISETFKLILKRIKVKRFNAKIDTGDYFLNANLYPLVTLLGGNYNNININFENKNSLDLKLQAQLFFPAWYVLRFYNKNKYIITKK